MVAHECVRILRGGGGTHDPVVLGHASEAGEKAREKLHALVIILNLADSVQTLHMRTLDGHGDLAGIQLLFGLEESPTQSLHELVAHQAIPLTGQRTRHTRENREKKIGHLGLYAGHEGHVIIAIGRENTAEIFYPGRNEGLGLQARHEIL